MSNADQVQPTRQQEGAHPVRTATVVIYATFLLLILTIPQSLTNWLRDMEENPIQQVLLHAADAVQAASHRAGVDAVYIRARSAFRALAGKDED
jgi:hypothetical protein